MSIQILCVSILALGSRNANRIFCTQLYCCNVWSAGTVRIVFVHIISQTARFWRKIFFSSVGATARCGFWPVEQYSSIFLSLSPTLSIFHVASFISVYPVLFRPKSLNLSSLFLCWTNSEFFYCVGLLAPRQTPNLEDQGIPFYLGYHPWPVWHGRPYQYHTLPPA
jgi:hypothetical protein